ncbi:nicotinate-nucleotide pyrophosphorylase (carboxylating) [Desulfitispora alkaliphila]|uniref:carboxylating nicotinate-nucleotide diphosphorylase n=1 Tax=Desulfitispora alkaliphila TaxID=622674 RepID=UPI003D1A6C4C
MYNALVVKDIIMNALKEDMNYGDVTTDALIDAEIRGRAVISVKEDGIMAGIGVAQDVFTILDSTINFTAIKSDGNKIKAGEEIAIIEGKINSLLKAERLALNFLQRMSGIATKAMQYSDAVNGFAVRVVDTRKTTPGLRALEKYAVRVGGCYNHRYNLSDGVLIKDNHIKAVGGVLEAISMVKNRIPHHMKIEIEVENLVQLQEALDAGADVIMLDNMDLEIMRRAVEITSKRALLEASGNITLETVKQVAQTGVDIISVGDLTHSIKALDISLNIERNT